MILVLREILNLKKTVYDHVSVYCVSDCMIENQICIF